MRPRGAPWEGPPSGWSRSTAGPLGHGSAGRDIEAEHHAALVVLRDVAVRHPQTRVGDVEEDVDGLAREQQDRVLPGEVGLRHAVSGEDEEPTCTVDVE